MGGLVALVPKCLCNVYAGLYLVGSPRIAMPNAVIPYELWAPCGPLIMCLGMGSGSRDTQAPSHHNSVVEVRIRVGARPLSLSCCCILSHLVAMFPPVLCVFSHLQDASRLVSCMVLTRCVFYFFLRVAVARLFRLPCVFRYFFFPLNICVSLQHPSLWIHGVLLLVVLV